MLDSNVPSLHGECNKPFGSGFIIMSNSVEIWKEVPFSKNGHKISNIGNFINAQGKLMKINTDGRGYSVVNIALKNQEKYKTIRIHRLVAQLFIPNPHNLPIVMHLDDNKKNCHFMNLKWGTTLENNRSAIINGLNIPAKGVRRNKSNLTELDVIEIFKSKETSRKLAEKYGVVSHNSILAIKNGLSWNHITGIPCRRKKSKKL